MKKNIKEIEFDNGEVVLLDKPYGVTSFGLVYQLRIWASKKVGHAGTLDPLASGLMILCTGKKTKTIPSLIGQDKVYTGEICLGSKTNTYDRESEAIPVAAVDLMTDEKIEEALKKFRGDILQKPPMFSAVKKDGKKLYELARKGEEVHRPARPLHIFSFEMLSWEAPLLKFRVHCSSGTYIRALANDLGEELGVGGYLYSLRRTAIGDFKIEDAYTLEELQQHFGNVAKLKTIEPHQ